MRSTGSLAMALSLLVLQPAAQAQAALLTPSPSAASSAPARGVDVMAVRSLEEQIQLVAAVRPDAPVPLTRSAITVTADGASAPAEVAPILSAQTPVELIVDASASGTASVGGGGLSGATGLLLQLPPGAISGVVADRTPPQVLVRPSAGVADDLQALSELQGTGAPATSDALNAALLQLPAKPAARPVVVLYTAQRDAGGQSAQSLVQRLRQANAVLAVVTTAASTFWSQVTAATGGLAILAQPARQIAASDQLADALHARYSVTFPRPSGAQQATIRVATAGGQSVAQFPLPVRADGQETGQETRTQGQTQASTSMWGWRAWGAAFVVFAVILAVVLAGYLLRRRAAADRVAHGQQQDHLAGNYLGAGPVVWDDAYVRGPKEPDHTDDIDSTGPIPGVRVFDVTSSAAPLDITNSLFEPRSVRDAREREEAGRLPEEEDQIGS